LARDRLTGPGATPVQGPGAALPGPPRREIDLWDIEARVKFSARGRAFKVSLFTPPSTRRLAVVDENFISRGFG